MKKPVFVAIVACLALLAAGPLVTGSSADDLDFMLRTTPETPRNWTPWITAFSGTPSGTVEYTGGPRVPKRQGDFDVTPHGGGSLTLRTGESDASSNQNTLAQARNPFLDGAPVGRIDIEYSWIVTQRDSSGGDVAPSLELTVTGENGREILHYEPYLNTTGGTPVGAWDRDDAGAGLWWGSSDPEQPPFTLEQYALTHNPNATVVTDQEGGAFAVSAGCCSTTWKDFEGAVDDVLLERIGSPRTTFDFEPSIFEVRPSNLQGWSFVGTPVSPDSPSQPSVSLVTGPTDATDPDTDDPDPNDADDPFFGIGSLRLDVGDNGSNLAEARNADLDGMDIADVDALAYGTYVMTRLVQAGGCEEAPFLSLDAVMPGPFATATERERELFFHPCDQTGFDPAVTSSVGGVPLRTWQRWDAAEGVWRWQEPDADARTAARAAGAQCDDTSQTCRGTLTQFDQSFPADPVAPGEPGASESTVAENADEGGSLAIAAGGGDTTNPNGPGQGYRWANFVGHADFLTHDTATTTGRTYDFESEEVEPEPVPPTSSTSTPTGATTTTTVAGGTTTTTVAGGTTTTTAPGATTTTTRPPTTTTTRQPGTSTQVSRMDGADRMATAIDISQSQFPDETAGAVVLTRADNYPDALAASPVAANRGGPLLLTPSTNLDDRVAAELHRVLPDGGTVHIAGGTSAIRTEVENELRNAGYNVIRHAGRNRFETATLLAEQIPQPTTAYLATGLNFADALPSGAAAAASRGVVLLTADSSMPAATAAYLNARPNLQRVAIGGPASRADPSATSVVGVDRFETAANVATRFFTGVSAAGVASGTNFPDALAGGAHAGSNGGPLLLTRPESLPEPARQYLEANRDSLRDVFIYGGPNAVSTQTETQIRAATS